MFEEAVNLLIAHLSENIQAVRDHSAYALIQLFKSPAHIDTIKPRILEYIQANLLKAKE